MSELAKERIDFINQLHEAFLINRGYGAFAYITLNEVIDLFDHYLNTQETPRDFISRYMRSL